MKSKREEGRTARLGVREVNKATAEARRYTVWDTDLKGFGLRVATSGRKTYVVRYRVGGGRRGHQKEMLIGHHGTLTTEEARVRAKKVLGQAADGQDPQGDKAASRAQMTVTELCDLYMLEGVGDKKESTLKIDRIRIARHIKPTIGRLRISEVSKAKVEGMMRDISSGKIKDEATPHTRGGKHAAARTVGLLGGIFTFAIERKLLKDNPTAGVKRPKDNHRDRFLTGDELTRLADAMAEMTSKDGPCARAEGNIVTKQHMQIVRLLLFTGARKSEIVGLRWAEVDRGTGFIRLGDSKSGKKAFPLADAAATVLAGIDRTDAEWVFPDPKDPGRPVRNFNWAWHCIRKRAGLTDVRPHDLRHSFASMGAMAGHSLPFIGKLLGHKRIQSTVRYAHLADSPVKLASHLISEAMSAAMDGSAKQADDDAVDTGVTA